MNVDEASQYRGKQVAASIQDDIDVEMKSHSYIRGTLSSVRNGWAYVQIRPGYLRVPVENLVDPKQLRYPVGQQRIIVQRNENEQ